MLWYYYRTIACCDVCQERAAAVAVQQTPGALATSLREAPAAAALSQSLAAVQVPTSSVGTARYRHVLAQTDNTTMLAPWQPFAVEQQFVGLSSDQACIATMISLSA